MKRTFILWFVLLWTYIANGQDSLAVSDEAKSFAIVSRLSRELSLNKDQERQVYEILQQRWTAIRSYKNRNERPDRSAINARALETLKGVLTTSQYERFLSNKRETQKQKAKYRSQHPGYKFSEEDIELEL